MMCVWAQIGRYNSLFQVAGMHALGNKLNTSSTARMLLKTVIFINQKPHTEPSPYIYLYHRVQLPHMYI